MNQEALIFRRPFCQLGLTPISGQESLIPNTMTGRPLDFFTGDKQQEQVTLLFSIPVLPVAAFSLAATGFYGPVIVRTLLVLV